MNAPPPRLIAIIAVGLALLTGAWVARSKLSAPRTTPGIMAGQGTLAPQEAQAIAGLEQTLAAQPGQLEARYQLADYYMRLQRPRDAEKVLQEGCRLAPGDAQAWLSLGDVELRQEQLDAAAAAYAKATDLAPNDAAPLCALAQLELRRGRLTRVRHLLQQAAHADPQSSRVHFIQAQLLMRTAPAELAIPELQQAIKLEPQYLPAWLMLASVTSDLNQTAAMRAACQGALKLDPGNPAALGILSHAKMQSGSAQDLQQAGQLAEQALRTNPQDGPSHMILGLLDLRANHNQEAIGHLEAALLANRSDTEARSNLAKAYQRVGRAADAALQLKVLQSELEVTDQMRHLTTQSKMRPRDPDLHYQLGNLYVSTGANDKAKSEYETALEMNPQHQAARRALQKLTAGHATP